MFFFLVSLNLDFFDATEDWRELLTLFLVGCTAQWLERWSFTGQLSCPTLNLQLTGDHLRG